MVDRAGEGIPILIRPRVRSIVSATPAPSSGPPHESHSAYVVWESSRPHFIQWISFTFAVLRSNGLDVTSPSCPQCHSQQVQSLSMVHQMGTSSTIAKGKSVGVTGGGSIGVMSTRTKGISQTVAAQRFAPPTYRSVPFFLWLLLVGGIVVALIGLNAVAILIGIAMVVPAIAQSRSNGSCNKKEFPKARQLWEQCWLCHQCGFSYIPAATIVAALPDPAQAWVHPYTHQPAQAVLPQG